MSKAKGKKKVNPEELMSNEEKEMYACRAWGLQAKLAMEKERTDLTKAVQLDLKQRVIMLSEDLKKEKEKSLLNSMSMASESKQLQEKMNRDIELLKTRIEEQKKILNEKDEQIKELNKAHESSTFKKDEEIRELKRKIDEMNVEFSKIMKVS